MSFEYSISRKLAIMAFLFPREEKLYHKFGGIVNKTWFNVPILCVMILL